MRSDLSAQRCLNHAAREAVARCIGCHQFFCRECVTEHGDRMLCAACLRKQVLADTPRRLRWVGLLRLGQGLAGLLVAWFFFYLAGRALLAIPDSFHEGTLWRNVASEEK